MSKACAERKFEKNENGVRLGVETGDVGGEVSGKVSGDRHGDANADGDGDGDEDGDGEGVIVGEPNAVRDLEDDDDDISGQEEVVVDGRILDYWETGPQFILKLFDLTDFLDEHKMNGYILHGSIDDVLLMQMVGYNQRKLGRLMSEWGEAAMNKRDQQFGTHMIDRFRADGDFRLLLKKAPGIDGPTRTLPLTKSSVSHYGTEALTRAIKGLVYRLSQTKKMKSEYLTYSMSIGVIEEKSFNRMARKVKNVGNTITKTVRSKVNSLITEFERSTKKLKTFHATCLESVRAETNQLLTTLENNKAMIQGALEEHDDNKTEGTAAAAAASEKQLAGFVKGSGNHNDYDCDSDSVEEHDDNKTEGTTAAAAATTSEKQLAGLDKGSGNHNDYDCDSDSCHSLEEERSVYDDDPVVWKLPNGDDALYDVLVVENGLVALRSIQLQWTTTPYHYRDRSFYNEQKHTIWATNLLDLENMPQVAWEEWQDFAHFITKGNIVPLSC